jgi:hypothetical protein
LANSFITASPCQIVALEKKTFLNYLLQDSHAAALFVKLVPKFPKDSDLRRYKIEKLNWAHYKEAYIRERVPTPSQIAIDKQDIRN